MEYRTEDGKNMPLLDADHPHGDHLVMHAEVPGRGTIDTTEGPWRIRLLLNGDHETIDVADAITESPARTLRNAEILHRTAVSLAQRGESIDGIVEGVQNALSALGSDEED